MSVTAASPPRQVEPGRLELRVAVEGGHPLVAAEAGLLEAAERDRDVGGVERVDPDDPGPDRARQAVGAVDVARPDPGREAVRGVVGDRQGIGLVLELGHGQDRPEDLFPSHTPGIVHAVEDRRLDEEAAGLLANAFAAGHDPGAFLATEVDVVQHPGQLAVVDHGAQPRRGIERLARGDRPAEVSDPLDQLLADAAVHDEPRARIARLARVVEDPPPDGRGGRLEVADIGQDQLRALATELQRDGLHVRFADGSQQCFADLRRARERDLVDHGVAGEGGAEDGARPRRDVEHPVREARFHRELGEPQGRQRRLRGGLEHHGIARRERRTELPGRDDERVVPGDDRADDPDRLPRDERERVGTGRADLPVDLVDGLCVPLDGLRRRRDVDGERIPDGFPDVERFEQRQLVAIRAHEVGELQQHALAVGW